MKEIFYEESARVQNEKSAKTKYNLYNILSIICFILMALWVCFALTAYPLSGNIIIDLFGILAPIFVFLPSGILFYTLKNKFYIDYDYTFVSGTINVSKVIKNLKRRFILKFDTSSIEKLGKVDSVTFNKYSTMPGIVKHIFTSNEVAEDGKEFYYLVATINAEKKLMVFECTETFMVNVLKFSNKSIVEEDF